MRSPQSWKPTKYVKHGGKWRPSRDPSELSPTSLLSASLALVAIDRALKEHAAGHLADLGCGKVPFFGIYRDRVTQVTCIDWPQSSHSTEHIDVAADLNLPINLPSDLFDTILSSSVLEHIWDHRTIWAEMERTLKPGGTLILGVPFIYALHEAPHDYFRWTRFALEKACEETGLEIVSLEPYGGGIDIMADLAVRALGMVSNRLAGWAGRIAFRLLRGGVARRLSATAHESLPLGYLLIARKPSA